MTKHLLAIALLCAADASAQRAPSVERGAESAEGSARSTLHARRSTLRVQSEVPTLRVEQYTLPNGLEVILHEDHSTPVVAVNTWYKVGSGDEKRGRTGFAHLFEHLLFMGSQNVPTGRLDQLLEGAGASMVNGSTNTDRTNYYETLPANALPLALWIDADRMGFLLPTMDQGKLDLQRDVVKNERRQRVDNVPYGRAHETLMAALYPSSHPYSWPTIGSMADLTAATLDDVKEFFRTYYAPNNASLVIAGDFAPDSAKAWVARYFGGIPRGPAMPARPSPDPVTLPRDTALVLEDEVQLPRFWYAWHTPKLYSPDDAVLDVLAFVLAGDRNSRLYKALVYDAQVAQEVSAYQGSSRIASTFQIDVTPKEGQSPARVAAMVDAELRRLTTNGITERELLRARNSIRATFLDRLASVEGKADLLNTYNYLAGTPDYVRQDAARYDAVTAADVRRAAREYLGKPKVVLTVVPTGKRALALTAGPRRVTK